MSKRGDTVCKTTKPLGCITSILWCWSQAQVNWDGCNVKYLDGWNLLTAVLVTLSSGMPAIGPEDSIGIGGRVPVSNVLGATENPWQLIVPVPAHPSCLGQGCEEFYSCQGNVRDFTKSQGSVMEKILSGKSCLKWFIIGCIYALIFDFAELVHFILVSDHALLHFYPHHWQ